MNFDIFSSQLDTIYRVHVHSFFFKKKTYTPTRYIVSSCIEKTLFSSQLDTMYRVDV